MTKTEIAKRVTSTVVGFGTTSIVAGIIGNNVRSEKVHEQVSIYAATAVIGMMVADATKNWTDAKIDEVVAAYHELKSEKTSK